jgi:hypothetical protein
MVLYVERSYEVLPGRLFNKITNQQAARFGEEKAWYHTWYRYSPLSLHPRYKASLLLPWDTDTVRILSFKIK